MKKNTSFLLLAAAAAFCLTGGSVRAGTLTLDEGSPSYVPPEAFTNNTIVVDTTIGDPGLIHLSGGVTVAPTSDDTAMVAVSGTFSADSGDKFSVAYRFAADLNATGHVDYTLSGEVNGIPIPDITGTIEPGIHLYEGTAETPPLPLPIAGNFSGTLTLDFTNIGAGALPSTLDLTLQQLDFQLSANPVAVIPPSEPQNISTRANVGTGDNALIGGFIITGADPIQVVLRAIGPSLSVSGVAGVLADPTLELHDSTGAVIASNDNWQDNSAEDQMVLTDHNLAPKDDLESAIVRTLDPGAYTVIVRGLADTTGVGLVEAYDIDTSTTDSKLANISTRGLVETGDNVMNPIRATRAGAVSFRILTNTIKAQSCTGVAELQSSSITRPSSKSVTSISPRKLRAAQRWTPAFSPRSSSPRCCPSRTASKPSRPSSTALACFKPRNRPS